MGHLREHARAKRSSIELISFPGFLFTPCAEPNRCPSHLTFSSEIVSTPPKTNSSCDAPQHSLHYIPDLVEIMQSKSLLTLSRREPGRTCHELLLTYKLA